MYGKGKVEYEPTDRPTDQKRNKKRPHGKNEMSSENSALEVKYNRKYEHNENVPLLQLEFNIIV